MKQTWEILKRFLMRVLSTRAKRKKNTPENVGMGFSFFKLKNVKIHTKYRTSAV